MIGDLSATNRPRSATRLLLLLSGVVTAASSGCTAFMAPREPYPVSPPEVAATSPVPRELEMMSLPLYTIEPPDILLLQAVKVVPKPPYVVEPFDGLLVRAAGALPDQPIADAFFVDPEGMIDLGPSYGKVKVVGLTIDGAKDAIRKQLSTILEEPEVSVSLAVSSGSQQIVGEHLVGPDGRVNLGTYGSVYVTGLTLEQAKEAIEKQLSIHLEDPEVIVDMFSYNSKKYYIITQGGGFGDNVVQVPITGNETVLDAIRSSRATASLSPRTR
jgi:polysaccharide export outer membrane protein